MPVRVPPPTFRPANGWPAGIVVMTLEPLPPGLMVPDEPVGVFAEMPPEDSPPAEPEIFFEPDEEGVSEVLFEPDDECPPPDLAPPPPPLPPPPPPD